MPLSEDGVILAFGDSLTVGRGTQQQYSYPSVLQKLSNTTVLNYGVSGEITQNGKVRFAKILKQLQHKNIEVLLLLEGGNDIMRSISPKIIRNNLAQMITLAQQNNIQVVLISVPKKSMVLRDANLYQDLAQEFDILLIDNLISELLSTPKYKSDIVHLNTKGYYQMALSMYEVLQKNGLFMK